MPADSHLTRQRGNILPPHELRVGGQRPKRLIYDPMLAAEGAQRHIEARGWVEAILHNRGLDVRRGVDMLEKRQRRIRQPKMPNSIRHIRLKRPPR